MNSLKTIEKKISQLPPSLVVKLDDYLDFLLSQRKVKGNSNTLKQTWAGGLKEYKKSIHLLHFKNLPLNDEQNKLSYDLN